MTILERSNLITTLSMQNIITNVIVTLNLDIEWRDVMRIDT